MSNRKNSTGTAMLLGGVIGAAVAILGAVGLYALTNNQSEEETIKAIRKKWSERKGKTQSGETKAGEIQGFNCMITQSVMTEPVVLTRCGHTFEKQVIMDWISRHENCPICRMRAGPEDVQINYALKNAIEDYNRRGN